VSTDDKRLGSSGVFQAIVESARKLKRALSESGDGLTEEAEQLGEKIAQAFVAGRFADVHELGTPGLRTRTTAQRFSESWRDAVQDRGGTLTGFEVNNAGNIDLQYIPGLEEVPQDQFVAFLEIAFSTPDVPLDQEKAFAVAVVLLDEGKGPRVGAIHAR